MSDIKRAWKGHQFDWEVIEQQDTSQDYYICLNQREMAMILGALTPTQWRTRWINLPEFEDFQWIVELKAKLLCANGCCDGVEECIRGSEGIREIIKEIIRETTISDPGRPIGGDNPAFDSCNSDVIFGAVTSLVDYLNATIVDALQVMEVATNPLEAINLWADNIPIAGALASGLVEAIEFILENVVENYDANYTIALRDQYRCDLFCLWKESADCDITPAMVASYFADRIGSPDPLGQLNDVLQFIFTGVWAGSQIVDLMHLIALGSLVAVDSIGFFDAANAYTFTVAVALGANSPDPDWMILCDECVTPVWDYCWLGGAGFSPAWAFNNFGGGVATYNSIDDRIDGYKNPPASGAAFIDMQLEVNDFLSEISVTFSWNATRSSSTDFIRFYVNGVVVASAGVSGQTSQTLNWTVDPAEEVTTVRIEAAAAVNSQADAGYMRVTSIVFHGINDSPYGPSTCE